MKIPQKVLENVLPVFILVSGFLSPVNAQSTPKQDRQQAQRALIKNIVDSQHYVFNAQIALSTGGKSRQLTGDYYDLEITGASIIAYLPFYGRAYSAPLDPSQGGIQFTSKKFDYKSTPRKKGGWDILIKTNDLPDAWQLSLSISEDGYATLYVTGGNRQAISFNGTIVPQKQKNP